MLLIKEKLKIEVFWDVMLCHWVSGYLRFERS